MSDKETLTQEKYLEQFKDKEGKALERAWKNRDFEIDLFWKRAMYFWAFITLTYASFSQTNGWKQIFVVFIGSLLAWVWCLVHQGSKKWQRNWEKHIDLLEDAVDGPIYKTVLKENSFSVSKLSFVVTLINLSVWILLSFAFLVKILWVSKTPIPFFDLLLPTVYAKLICLLVYFLLLVILGWIIWWNSRTSENDSVSFEKRSINYKVD